MICIEGVILNYTTWVSGKRYDGKKVCEHKACENWHEEKDIENESITE